MNAGTCGAYIGFQDTICFQHGLVHGKSKALFFCLSERTMEQICQDRIEHEKCFRNE